MRFWSRSPAMIPWLALAIATPVPASAPGLTPETRRDVIDHLDRLLDDLYVIPETADAMIARLDADLSAGRFDTETEPAHFAETLTRLLQDLSGDIHLRVSWNDPSGEAPVATPEPRRVVRRVPGSGATPRGLDEIEPFPRAEVLPGNVACVEVRLFSPGDHAQDAAARVMETIADADAVVFDLRRCMGGAPDMVHFITSYLYGPEPRHLLTYYHAQEAPDSAYTLAAVPGRRRPEIPVFIVTSGFTASGGEEFTYVLQQHGRATVVGERTVGAGHGGGVHAVAANFEAFIPDFRPVHPVTGRGWESVGVQPDLEAPADRALDVAVREALLEIQRRHPERAPALADEIAQRDAAIERASAPVDVAKLREFAGDYGIRTIRLREDGLTIQRQGGPELRLAPADAPDAFTVAVVPDSRLEFRRDVSGQVTEVHVRTMTGDWEVSRREGEAPGPEK
ncbi:MAG: S41 family peptidase [bacterium]